MCLRTMSIMKGYCISLEVSRVQALLTFLEYFGGTSGKFGRAMVRKLVRTNECDILP